MPSQPFPPWPGDSTAALELLKKAEVGTDDPTNEFLDETDPPNEAMTEADNVPNYQRRVLLRAVTFNNLCCCLAINEDWSPMYGFAGTAPAAVIINEWFAGGQSVISVTCRIVARHFEFCYPPCPEFTSILGDGVNRCGHTPAWARQGHRDWNGYRLSHTYIKKRNFTHKCSTKKVQNLKIQIFNTKRLG